jgi:AraC-like DNA-binding protein
MTVSLLANDLQEILFEGKTHWNCASNCVSDELTISNRFFEATFKEKSTKECTASSAMIRSKEKTVLRYSTDQPCIELHFRLSGPKTNQSFRGLHKELTFQAGEHTIVYAPPAESTFELASVDKKHTYCQVRVSHEFLFRFLEIDLPRLDEFCKKIHQQQFAIYDPHHRQITPQLHVLLREIFSPDHTPFGEKFFFESRITELLRLQLECFENRPKAETRISQTDIERLYEVKRMLDTMCLNQLTIYDLSRQVGMNQTKLQNGFKQLFHTTVFKYHQTVVLENARRELLEGLGTISEISERCGYRHAHHFTVAFYKKFGILPRQLKDNYQL